MGESLLNDSDKCTPIGTDWVPSALGKKAVAERRHVPLLLLQKPQAPSCFLKLQTPGASLHLDPSMVSIGHGVDTRVKDETAPSRKTVIPSRDEAGGSEQVRHGPDLEGVLLKSRQLPIRHPSLLHSD